MGGVPITRLYLRNHRVHKISSLSSLKGANSRQEKYERKVQAGAVAYRRDCETGRRSFGAKIGRRTVRLCGRCFRGKSAFHSASSSTLDSVATGKQRHNHPDKTVRSLSFFVARNDCCSRGGNSLQFHNHAPESADAARRAPGSSEFADRLVV